jgi:hypothetical protein
LSFVLAQYARFVKFAFAYGTNHSGRGWRRRRPPVAISWKQVVSGNWATAADWSARAVPISANDAVIVDNTLSA